MELNITVFVQIAHFIIAYCALERLFFRPAFFSIQERDRQLKELQDTLAVQTQQVVSSREGAEESRLLYQKKLAQAAPSLSATRAAIECADSGTVHKAEEGMGDKKKIEADKSLSLMQEQKIVDICKNQLLAKILS